MNSRSNRLWNMLSRDDWTFHNFRLGIRRLPDSQR